MDAATSMRQHLCGGMDAAAWMRRHLCDDIYAAACMQRHLCGDMDAATSMRRHLCGGIYAAASIQHLEMSWEFSSPSQIYSADRRQQDGQTGRIKDASFIAPRRTEIVNNVPGKHPQLRAETATTECGFAGCFCNKTLSKFSDWGRSRRGAIAHSPTQRIHGHGGASPVENSPHPVENSGDSGENLGKSLTILGKSLGILGKTREKLPPKIRIATIVPWELLNGLGPQGASWAKRSRDAAVNR
jgi:hypothetical protein